MTLIEQIKRDRDAWWRPTPTDDAWLARLREDYPENAHLSDDSLRDYYEGYQKFATTWDHTGDAYSEYEPLAERFLEMEAALLVADELAGLLDRPDQADGTTGRYHYNFERVDETLAAWNAATKGDRHD